MKYLTMILLTFFLISCGHRWTHAPAGKVESDVFNDDNECRAISLRNTRIEESTFYYNCMRGKGYR